MKKILYLIIILISVSTCDVFARDEIKIVGSSTVYPFSTTVAEKFGSYGDFKTPIVESNGTGGGMKLFCQGVGDKYPDITNASRAIKASEYKNCVSNGVKDIIEVIIGNDGIAFANNTNGKKLNFTKKHLWTAMAAKGPKPIYWSEIDDSFPKSKIEILTPPPTSGTRDAWNSLVMEKGCDAEVKAENKKDCHLMREDGPVVEAGENDNLLVQKLASNPNAYGIFGFSYLDANKDKIQAATIEGKTISLESIQSYDYPVSRPLYFYVKKAHVSVVPGMSDFLNEFTSKKAIGDDGYLIDKGLIPLDSNKLSEVVTSIKELKTINLG